MLREQATTSLRPSRTADDAQRRRGRPYPTEPDAVSDAATEANQSPAEGASGTNRMNGVCDLPSPPTNTGVGRRAARRRPHPLCPRGARGARHRRSRVRSTTATCVLTPASPIHALVDAAGPRARPPSTTHERARTQQVRRLPDPPGAKTQKRGEAPTCTNAFVEAAAGATRVTRHASAAQTPSPSCPLSRSRRKKQTLALGGEFATTARASAARLPTSRTAVGTTRRRSSRSARSALKGYVASHRGARSAYRAGPMAAAPAPRHAHTRRARRARPDRIARLARFGGARAGSKVPDTDATAMTDRSSVFFRFAFRFVAHRGPPFEPHHSPRPASPGARPRPPRCGRRAGSAPPARGGGSARAARGRRSSGGAPGGHPGQTAQRRGVPLSGASPAAWARR